jgi:hypothetical protein
VSEQNGDRNGVAHVERKIQALGKIVILIAAVGGGTLLGYAVQNYNHQAGWGWPAAIATGLVAIIVSWSLSLGFK